MLSNNNVTLKAFHCNLFGIIPFLAFQYFGLQHPRLIFFLEMHELPTGIPEVANHDAFFKKNIVASIFLYISIHLLLAFRFAYIIP